ncbi:hypothetical protein CAPTEDRAFT_213527 [Capitella teleta]|uniref:Uncharacterized protein n=1 Tax=Capitella teleta TaxID=283909 RepID=R7VK57_CAPTE|nr:hypothetical protein CAPTEDRAFT_213527 [Capitella teleta]|eukprot:ELU17056.1 hypothetical protein CAPTEDRAFT_213527 [Capitella teleta]
MGIRSSDLKWSRLCLMEGLQSKASPSDESDDMVDVPLKPYQKRKVDVVAGWTKHRDALYENMLSLYVPSMKCIDCEMTVKVVVCEHCAPCFRECLPCSISHKSHRHKPLHYRKKWDSQRYTKHQETVQ